MDKFWDSISDLSNKTYSPFAFYFVIAWILHNHGIVAALLDDNLDPLIKSGYISTRVENVWDMFFIPVGHAMFVFTLWLFVHFVSSIAWDFSGFLTENAKRIIKLNKLTYTNGDVEKIKSEYETRIKSMSTESNELAITNRELTRHRDGAEESLTKLKLDSQNTIFRLEREKESLELSIASQIEAAKIEAISKKQEEILSVAKDILGNSEIKRIVIAGKNINREKVFIYNREDLIRAYDGEFPIVNKNATGVFCIPISTLVLVFKDPDQKVAPPNDKPLEQVKIITDFARRGAQPINQIQI